jgi:hypothetical protein
MAEYLTRDSVENVALNTSIPFLDSIPCPNGCVVHNSGSGIFILRGNAAGTNRFTRYELEFTGNISIPTGGEVTPIATAIVISGESQQGSRSITTPAAVDQYGNVTSRATIDVPKCCCITISVEYVSGVTDGTTTPTPSINVIDGSLSIKRIA